MHIGTTLGAGYRRSLEGYAKAGIRYVELLARPVEEFVRREGIGAARRLLSDLELEVVAGGSIAAVAEPRPERAMALEALRRAAELMSPLGVDRLVCYSLTAAQFTQDDYKRAADNLREAGDVASQFGMVAMLEFIRGSTFVGTLPTALSLTRAAAHPNVKPMFDFYHFFAGLSKLEDLKMIRQGEICHVHLQDVPDGPRELLDLTTREVPGKGVAPIGRALLALSDKGYSGPLSVELPHPRFQDGDPREVALHIRRSTEAVLREEGLV